MSAEKNIGYFLLLLGLGIILFSLLAAFDVFNGTKTPPKLFNVQKPQGTASVAGVQISAMEIVPVEYINRSGDFMCFLLYAFLSMYAGGKIASIGVSLINIKGDKQEGPKEIRPSFQ